MEEDIKQSHAGMTGGTNGSLGEAKHADLERGFIPEYESPEHFKDEEPFKGGCVGRPMGWER